MVPLSSYQLLLGPIVGYTDAESARVWIRVAGRASDHKLRVIGHGLFPFVSTEIAPEFGTAVAVVSGLRPDYRYRYDVIYRGRVVVGSHGSFRTLPPPGSFADTLFVSLSCSHYR